MKPVYNEVCMKVFNQLRTQVYNEVRDQTEIGWKVNDHTWNEVDKKVCNEVLRKSRIQFKEKFK